MPTIKKTKKRAKAKSVKPVSRTRRSKGTVKRKAAAPAGVSHEEGLVDSLKQDPAFAAEYLNLAMDNDDPRNFLMALMHVTKAFGGVGRVAKKTGLARESLYRTLSERGNPRLNSLAEILESMDMRLSVVPAKEDFPSWE